MKLSIFKKIVLVIFSLFFVFFVATELCILKYLKEYGYGIRKLPETTLVYFHLIDGVTIHCSRKENSIVIGRSDYIYNDIFQKNGYSLCDEKSEFLYYSKNDNNSRDDFFCRLTDDWCHWFRIYELSPGYRIEDFR